MRGREEEGGTGKRRRGEEVRERRKRRGEEIIKTANSLPKASLSDGRSLCVDMASVPFPLEADPQMSRIQAKCEVLPISSHQAGPQ